MKHEKIIKREDGSRVKIVVDVVAISHRDIEFRSYVLFCEKGKRTWRGTYDANLHSYRKLSMEDRRELERKSQFSVTSEKEVLDAKLELWQKLKPTA